jgi:hypothetical protein
MTHVPGEGGGGPGAGAAAAAAAAGAAASGHEDAELDDAIDGMLCE